MKITDIEKANQWESTILSLLQKLPQYNENDFAFKIEVGHQVRPKCDNYYFVEKGKYHNYYYDWREVYKKSTSNIKKAIYWILDSLIFDYALKFEKEHRIPYTDTRRQWMALEQEMFDIIGHPYCNKKRAEIAKILRQAPFDDSPT